MRTLACIGHITKDTIITPDSTQDLPGGSVWYISNAIAHLDSSGYEAVCGVGKNEAERIRELEENGLRVRHILFEESVCFENRYLDRAQTRREQSVTGAGGSFLEGDLEDVQADIIHLGSLLREDFPLQTIEALSRRALISADAQGFLRTVREGKVYPHDWDEKLKALRHIHFLKANRDEMRTVTGEDDPHQAALKLADWGVKEVLLTFDEEGSLIYSKGSFTDIPAYPCLSVVDATGCGDTYMAGYLLRRALGDSIYEAGCFAAAMCTIKLQGHGPFAATEQAVREIIRSRDLGGLRL